VIRSRKVTALTDRTRYGPNKIKPSELKAEMNAQNKKYRKGNKKITEGGTPGDVSDPTNSNSRKQSLYEDPTIFEREAEDSGKTTFIAGRSFSGKTYFVTEQINRLKGLKRGGSDPNVSQRPMYEKILILTTSPNAKPFKNLDKSLNIKIIPFYLPKIISLMKRISDVNKGVCPFLLILDDVFSSLKGSSFKSLILTMRNSNISTCVLSQHLKHCLPETRNSFHNLFVTLFKQEEWAYYIGSCLESDVEAIIGATPNKNQQARKWGEFVGSDIVWNNIRKDELKLIKRDLPDKK